MQRHTIGVIAILLLLGAIVFWVWPPQGAAYQQLEAACWRLGAVMVVWWIAYPQAKHLPPWLFGAIPVLIIILAVKPRWILVAIPILIALAILKPRLGRKK